MNLKWYTPNEKPPADPEFPAQSVAVLVWMGHGYGYSVATCEYIEPCVWREVGGRWYGMLPKFWAALPAEGPATYLERGSP